MRASNLQLYVGLTLVALVLIFIFTNTEVVTIQLLFWQVDMSRALMVIIVLGIGIAAGWFLNSHYRRLKGRGT